MTIIIITTITTKSGGRSEGSFDTKVEEIMSRSLYQLFTPTIVILMVNYYQPSSE
jgi:hypothetical protein